VQSNILLKKVLFMAWCSWLAACGDDTGVPVDKNNSGIAGADDIPVLHYSVIRYFPHDTTSYTEGLLFHKGSLFESTGSPDGKPHLRSVVGMVDLTNGAISATIVLPKRYFGEGIAFLNNKLYQLTYKHQVGFVYNADDYKLVDSFFFPSAEGWGLTTDGTYLIMSDGTNTLTYIHPADYSVAKVLHVSDNKGIVKRLNELEFVKGFLYANVGYTETIVKIDTATGRVAGRIDLSSLRHEASVKYPHILDMNGIAYDSTAGTFYVTGKFWPNIYEISFPH
jgi:Glutamine cyclotransferase